MGSGVCKTPPERRGARRHPWAAWQGPGCPLSGSQQRLAHGPPPQNRDKSSPCSGAPRTSPDTQGQRPASRPSKSARLLVWPLSSAAPGTLALSWRCTPGGGGRGGGQRASGLGWMKAWGLGFVLPICPTARAESCQPTLRLLGELGLGLMEGPSQSHTGQEGAWAEGPCLVQQQS